MTENLAQKLSQAAGMHNILVHLYLDIDHHQVFQGIRSSLQYYPIYTRQILTYLDSITNHD